MPISCTKRRSRRFGPRCRGCGPPWTRKWARRYLEAFELLSTLRPKIDAFFEAVLVMAEDPAVRANRLALLSAVVSLFDGVADLSHVKGR